MHLYQVTATSASLMHDMQKRMRKKEIENETTFYVFICRCTVPYAFAQVEFQRVIHPYISNMCASQFCLWGLVLIDGWREKEGMRKNEREKETTIVACPSFSIFHHVLYVMKTLCSLKF